VAGANGFDLAAEIRRAFASQPPALIIMLRSAGRRGDTARCRELEAAALMKPIKPSEMRAAIRKALGLPEASEEAPASLEPLAGRKLKVLVAEDNPVNQRVATLALNRHGHEVVIATDGGEALARLEEQTFDVVLMDVQMPDMDGFEATRRIREREKPGGRRVPVIACTAHAMTGDRERCLAAGMDGYVSKPLDVKRLLAVVASCLEGPSAPAPAATAVAAVVPPAESEPPPWSRAEALARVVGSEEALQEISDIFVKDVPGLQADIARAVAAGDGEALKRAAHRLRGSASFFEATAVVQAARALETMGESGDLTGAATGRVQLDAQISRLVGALSHAEKN